MSLTLAQIAWLDDERALPVTLLELTPLINGVPTMLRIATKAYRTGGGDVPAHVQYLPIAKAGVAYTETLSLTGEATLAFGDVEVENLNGEYDAWLDYVWTNCPVKAWHGDELWPLASFFQILDAVAVGIDSKSRDVLNVKFRDKLQLLNSPVTEDKLGGTGPNKDEIVPVGVGEIHGATPLLTDAATRRYRYNKTTSESLKEVRDNGAPVTVSLFPATSEFALAREPAGAITVDFEGDNVGGYTRTVAGTIQRLATSYGKAATRFTSADIDTANFAAFEAANPQPVGRYVKDRTNVAAVCQEIASSVGAQLVPSRLGKLRLLKIELPPPGPIVDIFEHQMVQDTLKVVEMPPIRAAVKLGFCRTWTVQEGLQTALPAEHKDLFATEFLTETAVDATVQSLHKLHADPVQQDTLLLRRVDAKPEAERLRDLWKVQRKVFEFEAYRSCLRHELGDAVRLWNRRFGLAGGKVGMVVSLQPNWKTGRVVVRVLV
jgi:hypothetical protein